MGINFIEMHCPHFRFMMSKKPKTDPILAKNPRHLGKIPLRPNILGCLGIFPGCLGVEKTRLFRLSEAAQFFYFKKARCQEKVTRLTFEAVFNPSCNYSGGCKR